MILRRHDGDDGSPRFDAQFEAFFDEDHAELVSAIEVVVRDRDLAVDVVDEAVARAWALVRRGRTIEQLPVWVRTAAMRLARKRVRHRRTERPTAPRFFVIDRERPTPPAQLAAEIDVQRALDELAPRQREVVVLRYAYDLSVEQIATELGISRSTVKNILHRARIVLSRVMSEQRRDSEGGRRDVG